MKYRTLSLLILSACLSGLLLVSCKNATDATTQFPVALSASPSDAGSVSPSEGSSYEEGSILDISATPKKAGALTTGREITAQPAARQV